VADTHDHGLAPDLEANGAAAAAAAAEANAIRVPLRAGIQDRVVAHGVLSRQNGGMIDLERLRAETPGARIVSISTTSLPA